ncbi:MFS transporter [Halocatena marina]|uniref:MFS transporter n=1 Tax=Halocatena marina TaxID=2934937 RepID=UPI00200C7F3D|nr:MFS transporter [Halocatena marina]
MVGNRTQIRMLTVASVSLLLSILVWFNYSAVLPRIVAEWDLSGIHAGLIFGAFQAGYLVAIIPAGVLVDRYSPRWVIAVGSAVTGVASLGFAAVATGFLDGTLLRFMAGIGMAGVYVPGMRFVADWYTETGRGTAMGIYIGTFSLGSGLSFLISSAVASAVDWRTAIAVTSVGALVVAPLILTIGRDAPTKTRETSDFDLSILRNRSYLAAVSVYSWHNWELFGVRNWLVAFLLATPAIAATGQPELTAGTLAGVMIAVGGLGNVIGGTLSDRVGRVRIIAGALFMSGLISAVLGMLQGLALIGLVALVLCYGLVLTMDSAPTSTVITELVADEHVGMALSVQSFIGFSTTVISPVVFGWTLDAGGYALAFPTLAAGACIALCSTAALRSTREKTATQTAQTSDI